MARRKSPGAGHRWWQGFPDVVAARRVPHGLSPRLEALESRVLPGDTLLGVAVVARQAFASPSCTPVAAVVPEGFELAGLAGPQSDSECAPPRAGRAGSKRSAQEEPGACSIREDAPQDVVLAVAEG